MDVIVPQFVSAPDHTDITKATLLSSTIAASTEPTWDVGTSYVLNDVVKYLTTKGTEPGIWKLYTALGATTGDNPEDDDGSNWVDNGATERYKMFDLYTMTESTDSSSDITINLHCNRINSISFLNAQAYELEIDVWEGSTLGDKIAGNKIGGTTTVDLRQLVGNWYEFFFRDFQYVRDAVTPIDLGLYYDVVVQVTFKKYASEDCFVGQVIPGRKYLLGSSQWGIETGIDDWSTIIRDENFGTLYLQQGNFSELLTVDVQTERLLSEETEMILRQLRAVPTLWIANQNGIDSDSWIVYGHLAKYRALRSNLSKTDFVLKLGGMI